MSGATGAPRKLNRDELTPFVHRLLEDDDAEIVTWDQAPFGWLNLMDAQLQRVSGTATVGLVSGRRKIEWSLVLKTFPRPPSDAPASNPASWDYWKREVITYTSGALDGLPGDLGVPRLLGVSEDLDGTLSLWLEEILNAAAEPWPMLRYRAAAHALGLFNASYLNGKPIPRDAGLGAGGLRSWVDAGIDFMETDAEWWAQPLMQRGIPAFEEVLQLCSDAPVLLGALDRLPQTFVHRDAWPRNLLVRNVGHRHERFVAIDWAICGLGAIGEEPAGMVGPALWHFLVEPTAAARLEGAVFAAYLAGLREGGWNGDEQLVRFGFTATLALRFAVLIPPWVGAGWLTDNPDWTEKKFGRPTGEIVEGWGDLMRFLLTLGDEARTLARSLRLL